MVIARYRSVVDVACFQLFSAKCTPLKPLHADLCDASLGEWIRRSSDALRAGSSEGIIKMS